MEVVEEQQMLAAEKNILLSLDLVDPPDSPHASPGKGREIDLPQLAGKINLPRLAPNC